MRLLILMAALLSGTAEGAPRIAIIIDDLGYQRRQGSAIIALPHAISCAIIPHTPHARRLADAADRQGKEVLIHMPMSAHGTTALDKGGLHSGIEQAALEQRLTQAIRQLPQARGLNNHMGSALTEQVAPMRWLMRTLRRHDLYFIDSRTTAASVAFDEAGRSRLPRAQRDIFLDNERELASINRQFNRLLAQARRHGQAIAIGHPYPETVRYLREVLPLVERAGYEIVPVSRLLEATEPTKVAQHTAKRTPVDGEQAPR